MANAQEGGQQARDDQDGQQDDERGREARRRHANEAFGLGARREDDSRRVVARLLQGESQIAGRHHLDDPVDADVLLLRRRLLADVTLTSGRSLDAVLFGARLSGGSDPGVRVPRLGRRGGRRVLDGSGSVGSGALIRALVATDLDGALEVDFHRVGEFESLLKWKSGKYKSNNFERSKFNKFFCFYLEVCVREDGCGGAEILDFGESRHELGPCDATSLVDQLDGRPFAVVGHAVADEHVEFAVVVLDGQDHGHRLADLDQSGDFGSPRALAHLDLHPAADVVTGKVGPDDVQHVDGERAEGDGLLVLVVPRAAQLAGLIPHFLHLRVELDNDRVLEECPWTGLQKNSPKKLKLPTGSVTIP